MKINRLEYLVQSEDLLQDEEFKLILSELEMAIQLVTWHDDEKFIINPVRRGNGVNPIKKNFVYHLASKGWLVEEKMKLINLTNIEQRIIVWLYDMPKPKEYDFYI